MTFLVRFIQVVWFADYCECDCFHGFFLRLLLVYRKEIGLGMLTL